MMLDVKEKREDVKIFPCLCRYGKDVIGLMLSVYGDNNVMILQSDNPKIIPYKFMTLKVYEVTRLGKGSSFTFTQE